MAGEEIAGSGESAEHARYAEGGAQPVVRDPSLQERRLGRAAAFRAAAKALAKEPRPTPVRLVPVGDHGTFVRVQPDPHAHEPEVSAEVSVESGE